ncbi:MAG: hypothetical protein EOP04_06585 [Proteobacteria bacterium]|nr:MAG: hypothetical protein EOP04_06585 [Pseudomonadota bacterium]
MKTKYFNSNQIYFVLLMSSFAWQRTLVAQVSEEQRLSVLRKNLAQEMARSQKLARDYNSLRARIGKNPGYDSTEKFAASIDRMWEKMQSSVRQKELADFNASVVQRLAQVRSWDSSDYFDDLGTEVENRRDSALAVLRVEKIKHEREVAQLENGYKDVMKRICEKLDWDTSLKSELCQ